MAGRPPKQPNRSKSNEKDSSAFSCCSKKRPKQPQRRPMPKRNAGPSAARPPQKERPAARKNMKEFRKRQKSKTKLSEKSSKSDKSPEKQNNQRVKFGSKPNAPPNAPGGGSNTDISLGPKQKNPSRERIVTAEMIKDSIVDHRRRVEQAPRGSGEEVILTAEQIDDKDAEIVSKSRVIGNSKETVGVKTALVIDDDIVKPAKPTNALPQRSEPRALKKKPSIDAQTSSASDINEDNDDPKQLLTVNRFVRANRLIKSFEYTDEWVQGNPRPTISMLLAKKPERLVTKPAHPPEAAFQRRPFVVQQWPPVKAQE